MKFHEYLWKGLIFLENTNPFCSGHRLNMMFAVQGNSHGRLEPCCFHEKEETEPTQIQRSAAAHGPVSWMSSNWGDFWQSEIFWTICRHMTTHGAMGMLAVFSSLLVSVILEQSLGERQSLCSHLFSCQYREYSFSPLPFSASYLASLIFPVTLV